MTFTKTTEQDSHYNHLETMSVSELLLNINKEDSTVPLAVNKALEQIESLINQILLKINSGGRLFYIGAANIVAHLRRYWVIGSRLDVFSARRAFLERVNHCRTGITTSLEW